MFAGLSLTRQCVTTPSPHFRLRAARDRTLGDHGSCARLRRYRQRQACDRQRGGGDFAVASGHRFVLKIESLQVRYAISPI